MWTDVTINHFCRIFLFWTYRQIRGKVATCRDNHRKSTTDQSPKSVRPPLFTFYPQKPYANFVFLRRTKIRRSKVAPLGVHLLFSRIAGVNIIPECLYRFYFVKNKSVYRIKGLKKLCAIVKLIVVMFPARYDGNQRLRRSSAEP